MMNSPVIPIRLRHSNLDTLHTCERKFQLDNLLQNEAAREESEHFSFGSAYGVGVAHYLVHQDADMALWYAWKAYYPEVEMGNKTIVTCMNALMHSFQALDTLLLTYEVATFNGKPAVEYGFKLRITDAFYFTGHIDVVLRHRFSGVHYIMDAKTTGQQLLDLSPLYMHSGQCLGYSIALDRVVGQELASYGVLYFVAQIGKSGSVKTHIYEFEKTLLDRLNWFLTLGLDVQKLEQMQEIGVFPKRGQSCLHYNRPCKYFGTCHLQAFDKPKIHGPDIGNDGLEAVYDFEYDLDELIKDHIARLTPAQKLAII